jgi:hypothetical protein
LLLWTQRAVEEEEEENTPSVQEGMQHHSTHPLLSAVSVIGKCEPFGIMIVLLFCSLLLIFLSI